MAEIKYEIVSQIKRKQTKITAMLCYRPYQVFVVDSLNLRKKNKTKYDLFYRRKTAASTDLF